MAGVWELFSCSVIIYVATKNSPWGPQCTPTTKYLVKTRADVGLIRPFVVSSPPPSTQAQVRTDVRLLLVVRCQALKVGLFDIKFDCSNSSFLTTAELHKTHCPSVRGILMTMLLNPGGFHARWF